MYCMLHICLTLLCAIIVATQEEDVITDPICGENQEYKTCGRACLPTCDDLRYPLPKPLKSQKLCVLSCISGCHCMEDFYRADDGSCVTPEQCCAENEQYKYCGSAGIETCDFKPTVYNKRCIEGCFCAYSDYVRQHNRTGSPCIHRNNCPTPCEDDDCPIISFI